MKLEFETPTLNVDFEKLLNKGIELSSMGEELSNSLKHLTLPIEEIRDKISPFLGLHEVLKSASTQVFLHSSEKQWNFPDWHFEMPPKVYTIQVEWDCDKQQ